MERETAPTPPPAGKARVAPDQQVNGGAPNYDGSGTGNALPQLRNAPPIQKSPSLNNRTLPPRQASRSDRYPLAIQRSTDKL